MTTPIIKIKVLPKPVLKGKMDVRFPAKVEAKNFLTVEKANGIYTFDIDYSLLSEGPIPDPTTAYIAVQDQTSGIYHTVSLAVFLASSLDADLQAIAALTGTGLLVRTADDTWALRSLTAPSAGITVTNPTGVGGNPTLALANDLAALEGLGSTGIAVRTAADAWAQRTITGPAAGLTVTNGNGVSGNPTLAFANDLAALEGLSGTGIARRTGADAWSVGTAVSNSELATMASNTFKGNVSGSPAVPADLTAAQVTAALPVATTLANGLVPQLPNDATKYFDGTGNFTVPAGGGGGGPGMISAPQGRLTLTSGVAIMNNSVAAATTIYYTPAVGSQIPLYDGTNMVPTAFTELSALTTDATKSPAAAAANSVYDLFVWNDGGILRLSRGPAWTNDGSRSAGTALTTVNGLWLNNVAITNGPAAQRGTYVGTIGTNSTATVDYIFGGATVGGLAGSFQVWNAYNRVDVRTIVANTTASWASGTAGIWAAAAGSATYRVTAVRGMDIDRITATYNAMAAAPSGAILANGIGVNTTTAFSGANMFSGDPVNRPALIARYDGLMGIGRVFVSALEYKDTAVAGGSWYGAANTYIQCGGLFVELMQ